MINDDLGKPAPTNEKIIVSSTRQFAQVGEPAHATGSPTPLHPYTLTPQTKVFGTPIKNLHLSALPHPYLALQLDITRY
ncbi:hypothetical protein [Anabaena azotica]|uniref:Uncharacterized protein n=1 Tax=Anabaena azotica FACHB-119 TaxID=947527 RepID=A0ABR8D361_9NOST|nr:hypothetical protein [Anabaena azotica]MBD2500198.1 hypothetical protein [Anabaena azotica FACHB-119]